MNKTALSMGLIAVAAFGAGYAMRGGAGAGTEKPGETAAGTRVSMREESSAGNGPGGARGRAGSSAVQSGQRAFPKGDAGKWLESLKGTDSDDSVAVMKLCQKCWAMDEDEAAELLAKCGEIMALQSSGDWEDEENFPDSDIVEGLAQQVALRIAGLSPAKALKLIKESEALLNDSDVMSVAFGVIADADPALALAEVRGLEDRSAAVDGIMGRLLAADDLFSAASLLELDPDNYSLTRRFLEKAIKSDPDLALSKGTERAVSGNEEALGLLLRDPVTRQRTVAWVATLQGPEADRIRGEMMDGLVRQDLPQAREVYSQLAGGLSEEERYSAAASIAAQMMRRGEAWEPWLESLDEKSRQAALIAVARAEGSMSKTNIVTTGIRSGSGLITRNNIDAVLNSRTNADFIAPIDEGPADQVTQPPSRAEELLEQLPASGEKSDFIASKVRSLMSSRPDEARAWVAQMPEGADKDRLGREIELNVALRELKQEELRAKGELPDWE